MFLNLLYLIVLTIPWGLYKKFVFPFSYLGNNPNSYLILRISPTDLLLLVLLIIVLLSDRFDSKAPLGHSGRSPESSPSLEDLAKTDPGRARMTKPDPKMAFLLFPALVFLALVMISSLFSTQKETSFYQTAHLILYLIFYFSLSRISDLKETFRKIVWLTAGLILLQALLALFQFIKQSFVLGFVPWGEPLFSASHTGSPLVNLFDAWKLRSFGTFSHPNVLGGFLSLVLVWIFDLMTKIQPKRQRIFLGVVFLLGLTALILTFSQASLGGFLIGLVLYVIFLLRRKGSRVFSGAKPFFVMAVLALVLLAIGRLPFDSVNDRRYELLVVSSHLISQKIWFGVGLGNFVRFSPPEFPEPVHNLYLLVWAETGLLALLVFSYLLGSHLKRAFREVSPTKFVLGISLIQLLFLGLFDHYLWTSLPGALMLWLVLGLISSEEFPPGTHPGERSG